MRTISSLLICITIGTFCYPDRCAAVQPLWRSAGVRGGFSADAKRRYFHQYEAFAVYRLPWEARGRSGWGVASQLALTAGLLTSRGDNSFVGSVGPAFSLGRAGFPLETDIGISVAFLNRDIFSSQDFNGRAQFISHLGLDYRFSRLLGCGYRFQHMSNAGLNGRQNPGLNLHLFGITAYFAD